MDFGITPEQLAQIVALWRRCGNQVAELDLPTVDLPGSGSLAVDALNACRRAAHDAATGRAEHLDALADALARFGALTEEADADAASALAAQRRR